MSIVDKSRVAYFYHPDTGTYYYGPGHPMKPQRIRMTHNLILNYGLYKKMEIFRPHPADYQEMIQFHSEDYVKFLSRVNPDNYSSLMHQLLKFNMGEYTDCPVFDGMYDYCRLYTGGSIDGAIKLNHNLCDIAINWAGGLHHAKKSESSGFCYVNDIVLAILELLKYHARVLYIDIDIHHGDGVEEAFYCTDRVMTVSLHKFGDFFPGTGDYFDTGSGPGKNYSLNVPLKEGITDETYSKLFRPVISRVMDIYQPSAVVLQCGADSLTGDRLGCFNLTLNGHADCVKFVKSYGLPTLVLGGGGYNIRNVSRCWAYETSVILDTEISNNIPYNDFFQYYGPDYTLHLTPSEMPNKNNSDYLEDIRNKIFQNLSMIDHAPSVQMHEVPPDYFDQDMYDAHKDNTDPDVRVPEQDRDNVVLPNNEFYEDDADVDQTQ